MLAELRSDNQALIASMREARGARFRRPLLEARRAELRAWLDGFWDDALARFKRAAEGSE